MSGLNLSQRETAELLDMVMTVVEQRRHNAGQQYELAKRRLNDANNATSRSAMGFTMDYWQEVEKLFKATAEEIDAVISEVVGQDWRKAAR